VLAELGRALRAADRETFIPHAAKLIYFIANSAKNPIISLYLESIMEASIYTPLDSATTDRLLQRVEDIKARLCRVADAVGSRDAQSAALAMVAYRRFITSLMAA
jgi:DNA-binding FadR family transcriptional regulator